MLMILSISGGVLSADRRIEAIEVRCASFTQILALPDNHGTRGRGRVRGRLRLKNENDSWIDEEETSRKWGARWLVSRSSQSFPNRTRPRTRARPRIRIHLGRSENNKGQEPSQTGLNLVPFGTGTGDGNAWREFDREQSAVVRRAGFCS